MEANSMSNTRVVAAIDAIKAIDAGYFASTLNQRLPATGAGSIVDGFDSAEELEKALRNAEWEGYSHEALAAGTIGFKTYGITGRIGIVDIDSLPADQMVTLDDRKNTGIVSATVQGVLGAQIGYTVAILGDENGQEVLFTIHPGDPVMPSKVPAKDLHGVTVSRDEALKMGLVTAKIVR